MQMLRALESAGRLRSFSRAAEELHTTQSAISRTIADLERRIAVRLFERHHRSVNLTEAGELYHRAVTDGLARIAVAASVAADTLEENRITIACGPSTSELFLMPRFETLRRGLGEDAIIRVLGCDYDTLDRLSETDADIVFTYRALGAPGDRVVAFREAVTPVCSPDFAATHADILRRPVPQWGSLPFLNFAHPPERWVTWEHWFEAVGRPAPMPRYRNYPDYVYMIDAAVAGLGLALGWRNFMDRFFNAGSLIPAADGFVEFDRPHFARLTERGRRRPLARRCLDLLGGMAEAEPSTGSRRDG